MTAVISRASRSISIGLRNHDHEVSAHIFVTNTLQRKVDKLKKTKQTTNSYWYSKLSWRLDLPKNEKKTNKKTT